MWTSDSSSPLPDTTCYHIYQNKQALTNQDFVDLLSTDSGFVMFFNTLLKESPYPGYFWEVKPVKQSTLNEGFEFVLVCSERIALKKPDPRPFLDFIESKTHAVTFPNLGKNAQLIAPAISGKPRQYAHLAGFVRNAPEDQIVSFWQLVGVEFQKCINTENQWLSTAGFGVNWLHVRIDQRPKYYRHKAYKI